MLDNCEHLLDAVAEFFNYQNVRPTSLLLASFDGELEVQSVTDYTPDPTRLMDPAFTSQFAGPNETFLPQDVRYFNWRMVLRNAEADVSVAPAIDSFVVSYRLESQ